MSAVEDFPTESMGALPGTGLLLHLADSTDGSEPVPDAWRLEAACRGMDTELFFPERGEATAPAKATCAECPVTEPCLEAGLDETFGIWGGVSVRERRRIKRQRKAATP
jgi:WhiB family redox-sensing transcriptional regulator